MRSSMGLKRSVWMLLGGLGLLTLALLTCHDAPRNNPFDPALTPPVHLISAAVDTISGTATLEWTPYAGQQSFAAYQVLRKVKGMEAEDTLAEIRDARRTTFRDTTLAPDVEYVYRVTVVNRGGFVVSGDPVGVSPFPVYGSPLLEARADHLRGTVSLRWGRYRGPDFEQYAVLRRGFGYERRDTLRTCTDPVDTTWVDAVVAPETDYLYQVVTFAAGQKRLSEEREVRYALPSAELYRAEFSAVTATAELAWTPYPGPGFEAYEIHRQAGGLAEQRVKRWSHVDRATYTDSLLDGNTTYTYWISVHTTWGIEVHSDPRAGSFYTLDDVWRVRPSYSEARPHAVSLALDEEDGLYLAMTTTVEGRMSSPLYAMLPGWTSPQPHYFGDIGDTRPDPESPIHVTPGRGKVYVSGTFDDGRTLVAALEERTRGGVKALLTSWREWVDTQGAFPAGLYPEETGEVWMVDQEGLVYRFGADGAMEEPNRALYLTLSAPRVLPLGQMMVEPGAGIGGGDQFFLLALGGADHHVIGRTRTPDGSFGGRSQFDEGVGLEDGQTFNPVAFAFDRAHVRLFVLEAGGRLQVFDGRLKIPPTARRYITKWGALGPGEGEFLIAEPVAVAMAVDAAGRVYVADVVGPEVRIQIFRP